MSQLCKQAWDFALSGLKVSEIAKIMNRPNKLISSYLWHERKRRGLTKYPFNPFPPTLNEQAWKLAKEGKDKRQIAKIMNKTLRKVNGYLYDQRKILGLTEFPFHVKSEAKRRHIPRGNIYYPDVDHRKLFKELAH